MQNYSFINDYNVGAHPSIYENMLRINEQPQHRAYGKDSHCENAREIIRELIGQPQADVVFISGGTQTNLITISYMLRSWEAVICCHTGHVAVHETGAIELTGHKVISVTSDDGKIYPYMIDRVLEEHDVEFHMVVPKMVFISQSTEMGNLYTLEEIRTLRAYCDEKGLLLHLDGARLGFALAAEENDVTLKDIGSLVDTFYIGGTKIGAMFGEALVIIHPDHNTHNDIRHAMKQRGALMAKGWQLGVQFETLLGRNGKLMLELCSHGNRMATILKEGLEECGFPLFIDSPTNMLFVVMPLALVKQLEEEFQIGRDQVIHGNGDEEITHILVRLVTNWATKEDECHRFVDLLHRLTDKVEA